MSWSLTIGSDEPISGQTYNLTKMWVLSGIVESSTRELDGLTGRVIAARCEQNFSRIINFRQSFEVVAPNNGWGTYEGFLQAVLSLWRAAVENPNEVAVWM